MAESVDPLKKSTKSESAENCLPRYMIGEIQSDFNLVAGVALNCAILCFSVEHDYH